MNVEVGVDRERRDATLGRLELLDAAVNHAVHAVTGAGPAVDLLRGLCITDAQARSLAASGRVRPPGDSVLGAPDAVLSGWAGQLGLDPTDLDLLLVAAAPDIDGRYEQLFGYLHDDITRRRATIGLALRLVGHDVTEPAARRRFGADAALVRLGLVEIDEIDRPFLTRSLFVHDRVVLALLGDSSPANGIRLVSEVTATNEWVERLARVAALRPGVVTYVTDRPDGTAATLVASALADATGEAVVLDVASGTSQWTVALDDSIREAVLRRCGLVITGVDSVIGSSPSVIDRLVALPCPVVLIGRRPWEPEWSPEVPLLLDVPPLAADERIAAWASAIGPQASEPEFVGATATFRLGPDRIRRAARAASLAAEHRGELLAPSDLQWGARQQNGTGLRRLTRRIEPQADWSSLVLPPAVSSSIREVASRVRHRNHVLDEWGLRRGGGRGDGITAMFSGPSGTGKTLAAEVIAHDLGVDLHTVDLATVVDKYIGETEKNLDRIFNESEQVNTVLFFDEADALFGKRSDVKDARDRYANVEVAYLLQRMERFDGAAILATNLRLNIDEAFARRLDVVVDFERPDVEERRSLWRVLIGAVPLGCDVDLDELAEAFDLSGGDIRNAVTTAAYLAVERTSHVEMLDLVRAVAREYRKLGRLCLAHEFGDWFDRLDPHVLRSPDAVVH